MILFIDFYRPCGALRRHDDIRLSACNAQNYAA
jgi:hypothetical protein